MCLTVASTRRPKPGGFGFPALSALVETATAYRFHLGVYVRSVGRLELLYMALINPFANSSCIRPSYKVSGPTGIKYSALAELVFLPFRAGVWPQPMRVAV